MTGSTVDGYCGSVVRDPDSRGVAMLVKVTARKARDRREAIDQLLYPVKRENGSCFLVHSDKFGDTYECTLLIGAQKQQTGRDAVRAVAMAAQVPMDQVTYTSLGGVKCFPTQANPGSPRAGMPHISRQEDLIAHR